MMKTGLEFSKFSGLAFKSKGFSLVELMVAILIGLIVLAGVIQVVVTSKSTFLNQEEMSYIQENARYAMSVISSEIKQSGYLGCAGNEATLALVPRLNQQAYEFLAHENTTGGIEFHGLTGIESKQGSAVDSSTAGFPNLIKSKYAGGLSLWVGEDNKADNDLIFIRKLSGASLALTNYQAGTVSVVGGGTEFKANEFAAVVGHACRSVGIFTVSADASNDAILFNDTVNCGTQIKPKPGQPSLCGPGCGSCGVGAIGSQLYYPGSTVFEYDAVAYYLGESRVLEGQPALKKATLKGGDVTEEELALGVESLNVEYLVSDGNNTSIKNADEVQSANEWGSVSAVKLTVTFRSQGASSRDNGVADFYRQTVASTIALRN